MKPIELDGRTGEGGGQVVRISCALAAVTSQPIRITHVRGNRGGPRGGGLKSQHVTSLQWLADVTGATVSGLSVGSHTVEFRPALTPPAAAAALLHQQKPAATGEEGGSRRGSSSKEKPLQVRIAADSPAASALLIFQAILPFLLFAGATSSAAAAAATGSTTTPGAGGTERAAARRPRPIDLEIRGGTNVSFSLSYEYLDQVLLPALAAHFEAVGGGGPDAERHPIVIERRLVERGWSVGAPLRAGCVRFRIRPLGAGETLRVRSAKRRKKKTEKKEGEDEDEEQQQQEKRPARIDASIVAPAHLHAPLQAALARDLDVLFPDVGVRFVLVEESGHEARMYVLLVAHTEADDHGDARPAPAPSSRRWGRDYLYDRGGWRRKTPKVLSDEIARKVTRDLYEEVAVTCGAVDEFLQDQLVVFQALAEGASSFPRGGDVEEEQQDQDQVWEQDAGPGTRSMADDEDVEGIVADIGKLQIGKGGRRMRRDRTDMPFGTGSTHTTTARWVAAELLPQVKWYNKGSICEGAGVSFS